MKNDKIYQLNLLYYQNYVIFEIFINNQSKHTSKTLINLTRLIISHTSYKIVVFYVITINNL